MIRLPSWEITEWQNYTVNHIFKVLMPLVLFGHARFLNLYKGISSDRHLHVRWFKTGMIFKNMLKLFV